MIVKTEEWERNNLVVPNMAAAKASAVPAKPKKVEKTAAMVEWERKNKGKKKVFHYNFTEQHSLTLIPQENGNYYLRPAA